MLLGSWEVTAKSNGSLPLRAPAADRDQLQNPMLVLSMGLPLPKGDKSKIANGRDHICKDARWNTLPGCRYKTRSYDLTHFICLNLLII